MMMKIKEYANLYKGRKVSEALKKEQALAQ